MLLCLVYTHFLFLSLSVIARCFVSFILVQFFLYICVYVTVLFIKEEEEEEEEEEGGNCICSTLQETERRNE